MNAVDTNILIYANDSRDPVKQRIAIDLVLSLVNGVLLWQVVCEYLAASRKLERFGYTQAQAWEYICDLKQVWYIALPNWQVLERTQDLMRRFSLSYWDAMIISACLEAKVQTFYTEDLGYSNIDGLIIVNPFSEIR
jgi:predicted nucleic acid-binding protein